MRLRRKTAIQCLRFSLESLAGAKFFSSFDLLAGFYNVVVDEESKEKTAFVCFKGLYEFNRMPMGLTNSPGAMQRLANLLVANLGTFARAYFDDILIISSTWQDHLRHLDDAFNVIQNLGVKLKASKAQLASSRISFLGHTISAEGMQVDQSKMDAIRNLSKPKTVADAQSLHGFLGYYRRFLPHFSTIAKPIVKLFSADEKFEWNAEQQHAFEQLRDGLL